MVKVTVVLGLFILFFSNSAMYAQSSTNKSSSKEMYGLRENCGKRASDYFKEHYAGGHSESKDETLMSSYRNHYSRKLNKCFIRLLVQHTPKDIEVMEKLGAATEKELREISENAIYGYFYKSDKVNKPRKCEVAARQCNSVYEWDSLVIPYMEE
jgi:hypothetical protein